MAVAESAAGAPRGAAEAGNPDWHWHPALPIENGPLFAWPPAPRKTARWLVGLWLPLTERSVILLIALATWFFLQPDLARCRTFEPGWIAEIYLRNLVLITLVAGGLQLYFYRFRRQGDRRRYDLRYRARKQAKFTFGDQLFDNIIWTLASGVAVWTAYEVLLIWATANGYLPSVTWDDDPLWFLLLILLIPHLSNLHFYWIHRWLHWPPLYRIAHAVHHRNIGIGPWSGLSMHPLEHLIFMSSVLIHCVLASHPIHILFHLQYKVLTAVTSHTGYEELLVRDRRALALGDFFHQQHHRYFECNYGGTDVPFDKWFGSFHDGTTEATRSLRARLRGEARGK